MKRVLSIVFLVLLLASCSTKKSYVRVASAIDFSEYTRSGFFITESNSVSFSYEPVSSVAAFVEEGHEVLGLRTHVPITDDDVYRSSAKTKTVYGKYIGAYAQDALDELYIKAKEMGADGIINLKMTYTPYRIKGSEVLSWESYYVSGMAIKRK